MINMKGVLEINIVIPMAGLGSRFSNNGYLKPKPFIDVKGKPMIERVIENLKIEGARFILIARKEHLVSERETVEILKQKYNVVFVEIDNVTEGAICTVLYSRKYINNSTPLLIANCDQIINESIKEFIYDCKNKDADGSILTFYDEERNPKWSFAKVNSDNIVVEVKEKVPISDYATVGLYYFSKGKYCVEASIDMIVRNDRVNNEFYTCPIYNYAIRDGKKITHYLINHKNMHGIGTPEDLNKFLDLNPLNY